MKKFILLIALFACFTACDDEPEEVTPEGEQTTIENGNFDVFSKVSVAISADLTIRQGDAMNVKFIGDQDIIDKMSTEVGDKEWKSTFKTPGTYKYDSLKIDITLPILDEVKLSGVSDINMKDYPAADQLKIDISGNGNFHAYDTKVTNCEVKLSGVADCFLHVTEALDVNISGVGDVHYKGSPEISKTITGIGELVNAN
jgi:hypothetical protein